MVIYMHETGTATIYIPSIWCMQLQRLLSQQYGDAGSTHSGPDGATNEVEPLEEVTVVLPNEGTSIILLKSVLLLRQYSVHINQ